MYSFVNYVFNFQRRTNILSSYKIERNCINLPIHMSGLLKNTIVCCDPVLDWHFFFQYLWKNSETALFKESLWYLKICFKFEESQNGRVSETLPFLYLILDLSQVSFVTDLPMRMVKVTPISKQQNTIKQSECMKGDVSMI